MDKFCPLCGAKLYDEGKELVCNICGYSQLKRIPHKNKKRGKDEKEYQRPSNTRLDDK
jgi:uncharacterized Zn finger protein (UPF0148 family)